MAENVLRIVIGISIGSASILAQNAGGSLHSNLDHLIPTHSGNVAPLGFIGPDFGQPIHSSGEMLGQAHISVGQAGMMPIDAATGAGHVSSGQTQHDSFGQPVGMALLHDQKKTSHIDLPGEHNNFLDIPVEHVVVESGPQLVDHGNQHGSISHVGLGQPAELKQQNGAIISTGSIGVTVPKLTGDNYMSSLVQGYGRSRSKPTLKQTGTGIKSIPKPAAFGEPLGMAIINQKMGFVGSSGSHDNFADMSVDNIVHDQTSLSQTQHGGFGQPVGMALIHDQMKTSHIDQPGEHDNFLDIPVEHIVVNEGPQVGGGGLHSLGQPSGLIQQKGSMLSAAPHDVQAPKLTGDNYMSSLVQGYGRSRSEPTLTQAGTGIKSIPKTAAFGEPLGMAIINQKMGFIGSSGSHNNFADMSVDNTVHDQTSLSQTQHGGFGQPVGMALIHDQMKTSHIDQPGEHDNFLDIPVEHIVVDKGPQVGGGGLHGLGQPSGLIQQKGSIDGPLKHGSVMDVASPVALPEDISSAVEMLKGANGMAGLVSNIGQGPPVLSQTKFEPQFGSLSGLGWPTDVIGTNGLPFDTQTSIDHKVDMFPVGVSEPHIATDHGGLFEPITFVEPNNANGNTRKKIRKMKRKERRKNNKLKRMSHKNPKDQTDIFPDVLPDPHITHVSGSGLPEPHIAITGAGLSAPFPSAEPDTAHGKTRPNNNTNNQQNPMKEMRQQRRLMAKLNRPRRMFGLGRGRRFRNMRRMHRL